MINIMIQELPPLHQHMTHHWIFFITFTCDNSCRHQSRIWFPEAIVESVRIVSDGSIEAILILRGQHSPDLKLPLALFGSRMHIQYSTL